MDGKNIQAKAVIEILGSPKEHVEETMTAVINKVKENFRLLSEKTYVPEELQGLWSSFAELEIGFKDVGQLVGFCFDFMPSSIEIIGPLSFNLKCTDVADLLNDLLAKLHRYDMVVKNLNAENILLKRKLGA